MMDYSGVNWQSLHVEFSRSASERKVSCREMEFKEVIEIRLTSRSRGLGLVFDSDKKALNLRNYGEVPRLMGNQSLPAPLCVSKLFEGFYIQMSSRILFFGYAPIRLLPLSIGTHGLLATLRTSRADGKFPYSQNGNVDSPY